MSKRINCTKGNNLLDKTEEEFFVTCATGKMHTGGRSNSICLIKSVSAPTFKGRIEHIFVDQAWHFATHHRSPAHLTTSTPEK